MSCYGFCFSVIGSSRCWFSMKVWQNKLFEDNSGVYHLKWAFFCWWGVQIGGGNDEVIRLGYLIYWGGLDWIGHEYRILRVWVRYWWVVMEQ